MPQAAWAIMRSTPERFGSEGAAGSRGWRSSTKVAAARGSVWGRLPMDVASPGGSSIGLHRAPSSHDGSSDPPGMPPE